MVVSRAIPNLDANNEGVINQPQNFRKAYLTDAEIEMNCAQVQFLTEKTTQ